MRPLYSPSTKVGEAPKPVFATDAERKVAQVAFDVIRTLESKPADVPTISHLKDKEVQAKVIEEVRRRIGPQQQELLGSGDAIAEVVAKTTEQVVLGTIDIPRIIVVPKGEVRCGYKPFKLNVATLRYPVPSDELWAQNLRDGQREVISLGQGGIEEQRLEDYVVAGLVDFDDVSYDDHADLLYDLATQTVNHLRSYLTSESDVCKVLRVYQKPVAEFIHSQMLQHYWEETTGYDVVVSKGFTELKESAFTASAKDTVLDYRQPPPDKRKIAQFIYSGFSRCLYRLVKFQSDTERKLAIVLERNSLRWFRPAKGQFQILYEIGHDQQEYQPDFVGETEPWILMMETKASGMINNEEVKAKRDAGVQWCAHAAAYATKHGGKPWRNVVIPHEVVAENMTLVGLVDQFTINP